MGGTEQRNGNKSDRRHSELTVEADVNLLRDWRSGVGVGGLTHELAAEVLSPEVVVLHRVHHRPVGRHLVAAVVDTPLLPPGDAGAGRAPGHLADDDQVVPHLERSDLGCLERNVVDVSYHRFVGRN